MKDKYKKSTKSGAIVLLGSSISYWACGLPLERGFAFGVWFILTIIFTWIAFLTTLNEEEDDA